MDKSQIFEYLLILFFGLLLIEHNIDCEVYPDETISQYARFRSTLPRLTNLDPTWRMSPNEDLHNHPCKRKCVANETMTCYYYLVVHYDETMGPSCQSYLDSKFRFRISGDKEEYLDGFAIRQSKPFDDCLYADGFHSEVMVINGRLPGQTLEVCNGDTIVADVLNSIHEMTTIHWHGLHQRQTPHMDGVPHVTQYPIEPGQAFRYRFEVDHAGTHWWHSHVEHQRAFGLAGGLVVRQTDSDNVHAKLYDFDYTEHVIIVQDWVYNFKESIPQNLLINGRGRDIQQEAGKPKNPTLYETFSVVRGGRYRFRVIFNGVANCPVSLSIDDHDLVVISSDGNDIEPMTVQKIVMHGGERFDFVLHANKAVDNYWIRFKGYNFCSARKLHQEAILTYNGASRHAKPKGEISYAYERRGIELNPIDKPPTASKNYLTIADTNALELHPEPSLTPYRTYYTSMSVDAERFLFQMDDITFKMPTLSLLQSRNLGIHQFFCNKTQQAALGFNCRNRHCKCANVIEVPAFKNIEFVISSTSDSAHPIHLHGYTFRVVGMGVLGKDRIRQIEEIDRKTPLPRRKRNAPLKDTVQVPAFGYTIIRFYTDSPGYWILHCHISTHSENGMAAVLRVGENMQMKMCPVSNCGLCSSVI